MRLCSDPIGWERNDENMFVCPVCYFMCSTRVCNQLEAENSELKLKLQRQSKRKTQSEPKSKESSVQVKAAERNSRSRAAPSSEAQSKRVQELEAANAALKEQAGFFQIACFLVLLFANTPTLQPTGHLVKIVVSLVCTAAAQRYCDGLCDAD